MSNSFFHDSDGFLTSVGITEGTFHLSYLLKCLIRVMITPTFFLNLPLIEFSMKILDFPPTDLYIKLQDNRFN